VGENGLNLWWIKNWKMMMELKRSAGEVDPYRLSALQFWPK
jgi:hypothetical protein